MDDLTAFPNHSVATNLRDLSDAPSTPLSEAALSQMRKFVSEAMVSEDLKGKPVDPHSGFNHSMFKGMSGNDEVAQIMRQFFSGLTTKNEHISRIEAVRDMEIVQTVVAVLIDDGFINSSDTSNLFKIEYTPKKNTKSLSNKMTKEIEEFIEKINLQTVVSDILEDLLLFGEYYMRTVYRKGEGIVELVDDVEIADVLPVYRQHEPSFYLVNRSSNMNTFFQQHNVIKVDPHDICSFVISKKKIRLKVDSVFANKKSVAEHIRMGQSAIYPVLSRLQQLQLTEVSSKISSLKEMVMPNVVSVGVPANTSPQDLKEITDQYENNLNNMLNRAFHAMGYDPENFEEIVTQLAASGVRVIPNFSDSKGAINQVDLGTSEARRLKDEGEDSVRMKIARALHIPTHYINPDQRAEGRIQDLKMFSRYTRKLISLQEGVALSLKRLIKSHFYLRDGTQINEQDLTVTFKSMVDMDLLDTMEFTMASVQVLQDFIRMVNDVNRSDLGLEFDPVVLREILLKFLVPLKVDQDLIKKVSNSKSSEEMSRNVEKYMNSINHPDSGDIAPEFNYDFEKELSNVDPGPEADVEEVPVDPEFDYDFEKELKDADPGGEAPKGEVEDDGLDYDVDFEKELGGGGGDKKVAKKVTKKVAKKPAAKKPTVRKK